MLRLRTERLRAGVFQEAGWLVNAGGKEINRYADLPVQLSVLDGLDMLLHEKKFAARAGIDLVVSDREARILYLPWQNKLSSEVQREAYARGCFEQASQALDGEWLVQTAYRWYQGGGLAYSLPRALVLSVIDRLAARRLRLRSIMPLSAHAYWHCKGIAPRGRSVLYLEERRRSSALLFGDRKCVGLHVQPGNSGPATTKRVLRTLDAMFPDVAQLQVWSVDGDSSQSALFAELLPKANIGHIDQGRWG